MAKTKAKSTKTLKKAVGKTKLDNTASASIFAAAAVLFAGVFVILMGSIQGDNNVQLLMVGFGAALLVFGGALVGLAIRR